MRNVLLNLIVVLSVFPVQGCWAGEAKSEIPQEGNLMESDATDAHVGPSFPCEKSQTDIEKMICADEQVSRLDTLLSMLYQDAVQKSDNRDKLQSDQRNWLKERNRCKDTWCLTAMYKERLRIINEQSMTEETRIRWEKQTHEDTHEELSLDGVWKKMQTSKCGEIAYMTEMSLCFAREYREYAKQLDDLYQEAINHLSGAVSLEEVRAAWQAYRDEKCRSKHEDVEGSIYPTKMFTCFIGLSIKRSNQIERYLKDECTKCFNENVVSDVRYMASRIPEAKESPLRNYERSYRLVKANDWLSGGKHQPLCDEMLKNLNGFPNEPPMVCERKFNPELGFGTPDWNLVKTEDIDWDILKQIYFSKRRPVSVKPENEAKVQAGLEKSWVGEKARLRELASKQTILWYAEFDIDNVVGKERVLMLRDADCSVEKYFSYNAPDPSLHVLQKSGSKLDRNYDRLNHSSLEVFRYKGHTYLSKWMGGEIQYSGAQLFILDAFKPQSTFSFSNKPICTYQYIR